MIEAGRDLHDALPVEKLDALGREDIRGGAESQLSMLTPLQVSFLEVQDQATNTPAVDSMVVGQSKGMISAAAHSGNIQSRELVDDHGHSCRGDFGSKTKLCVKIKPKQGVRHSTCPCLESPQAYTPWLHLAMVCSVAS